MDGDFAIMDFNLPLGLDVALAAVLVPVLVMVLTLILIVVCACHWKNRYLSSHPSVFYLFILNLSV